MILRNFFKAVKKSHVLLKIRLSCTNDREGKPLLKRRAKIWGNIFVQKRWYDMYDDGESSAGDNESLGYASYHFEEEKSYISYSSGEHKIVLIITLS